MGPLAIQKLNEVVRRRVRGLFSDGWIDIRLETLESRMNFTPHYPTARPAASSSGQPFIPRTIGQTIVIQSLDELPWDRWIGVMQVVPNPQEFAPEIPPSLLSSAGDDQLLDHAPARLSE